MRSVCTLAVIGCLMAAWVSTRADAVGRCVDGCVGPGLCGILGGVGIRKGPLAIMAAVGLGIGIEIYFGLMLEPSPWIAAISTFLAILAIIIGRRWPWLRVVGTAALLLACGLGIAQWHTHNVAAPKLAKQIYARTIEGRVAQVWAMPRGPRLLLGELSIVNVQPSQTPKLVRVTTRQSRGVLVGDRVRLRPCVRASAVLAGPPGFV